MPAIDLEEDKPKEMTTHAMVIMVVVSAVIDGFIISHLWRWFVVPLGVHPIGIAQAVGLDALWRAFSPNPFSKNGSTVEVVARMFYRACAVLSIGYVAHLVMGGQP